jgi:hypothetical protein
MEQLVFLSARLWPRFWHATQRSLHQRRSTWSRHHGLHHHCISHRGADSTAYLEPDRRADVVADGARVCLGQPMQPYDNILLSYPIQRKLVHVRVLQWLHAYDNIHLQLHRDTSTDSHAHRHPHSTPNKPSHDLPDRHADKLSNSRSDGIPNGCSDNIPNRGASVVQWREQCRHAVDHCACGASPLYMSI